MDCQVEIADLQQTAVTRAKSDGNEVRLADLGAYRSECPVPALSV
jgi:hypothetical protein